MKITKGGKNKNMIVKVVKKKKSEKIYGKNQIRRKGREKKERIKTGINKKENEKGKEKTPKE